MPNTVTPIRSSTQDFVDIEDIRDDLIVTRDGSCALIIETTAVNFGLLSEKEQEALIFAYSGLLNSLSFPIQLYLRSKHKDISSYLKLLEVAEEKQPNQLLKTRIKSYREFIAATVKERNVLDKKFFIVIPFSALELGAGNVKTLLGKKGLPYSKDYITNRAKTVLTPKRDHLLRQLNRLGLKGTHLTTVRLIELFHDIYNQDAVLKPTDVGGLTTTFVSKQPW
jgi:hypothetical protein